MIDIHNNQADGQKKGSRVNKKNNVFDGEKFQVEYNIGFTTFK